MKKKVATTNPSTSPTPTNNSIDLTSLDYFATDRSEDIHIDKWNDDQPLKVAGKEYSKGIVIFTSRANEAYVAYKLNGEYTRLTGLIGAAKYYYDFNSEIKATIYGDDRKLYESPVLKNGEAPDEVDINVANVDLLKIYFETDTCDYPAFVNPKLFY